MRPRAPSRAVPTSQPHATRYHVEIVLATVKDRHRKPIHAHKVSFPPSPPATAPALSAAPPVAATHWRSAHPQPPPLPLRWLLAAALASPPTPATMPRWRAAGEGRRPWRLGLWGRVPWHGHVRVPCACVQYRRGRWDGEWEEGMEEPYGHAGCTCSPARALLHSAAVTASKWLPATLGRWPGQGDGGQGCSRPLNKAPGASSVLAQSGSGTSSPAGTHTCAPPHTPEHQDGCLPQL